MFQISNFLVQNCLTVKSAEVNVHPDVEASRRPRRLPLDDVLAVDDHLGVSQSPLDFERVPLKREQRVLASQDGRAWKDILIICKFPVF